MFENVKDQHNNLGNKGPDTGAEEGILYSAVYIDPYESTSTQVLVKVNVASNSVYTPYGDLHKLSNGMHGDFAQIVVKSGTHVDLRITVLNESTHEPVVLPLNYLTFLDLDNGINDTSIESVTIDEYSEVHRSKNTEVIATSPERHTFTGSTYGDLEDNPRNTLPISRRQLDRAVTWTFKQFGEIRLSLKATKGVGPRIFNFVGRPSVLCAEKEEGPLLAKKWKLTPAEERSRSAVLTWSLAVVTLFGSSYYGVDF